MKNIFLENIKDNLLNFYIVNDDEIYTVDNLVSFLKENHKNENLNILVQEYNSFTIGDSIDIAKLHNEKNIDREIFILKVKYFTHEAQNALLKLLEDTKTNKHFFIMSKNLDQFLDTILSRAFLIKINIDEKKNDIDLFIKKNKNERLKYIEEIIKTHKNDSDSGSVRNHARELIDNIESYLYKNSNLEKKDVFKFKEINNMRKYLSTPGSSVKMILEHIALVI